MEKIVVTSTNEGAGKTSMIVGIMKASGRKCGYIKPFGDRLVYRKKRLWDHDSELVADLFHLGVRPEDMTMGFEHAKLQYIYNAKNLRECLINLVSKASKNKDVLFIEGGSDLKHGASVNLDAISIARYTGGKLVLVVDGSDYDILDDIVFAQNYLDTEDINFAGIIINKVKDEEDFKETHLKDIKALDLEVLGIVPYREQLKEITAKYLSERISAKAVTGEAGLEKTIKNVFVGDMSATSAQKNALFKKENKLVITSGDRSDMILAAIESNSSCIILTNNILPHSSIISKACDYGTPLLLVPSDTYSTAMQVEHIEPLLTKDDGKVGLLAELAKRHVRLNDLLGRK